MLLYDISFMNSAHAEKWSHAEKARKKGQIFNHELYRKKNNQNFQFGCRISAHNNASSA